MQKLNILATKWHSVFITLSIIGLILFLTGCPSTTSTPTNNPPNSPTNVKATPGINFIDVTWDDSTNETGFTIHREITIGTTISPQTFTKIAEVAADVTTYRDRDVEASKSYTYKVAAINTHGSSEQKAQTGNPVSPKQSTQTDTKPDAFTFTAQENVKPSTLITSNTITVKGINAPAPISADNNATLLINGRVSTASTVNNNDTVAVRLTSSSDPESSAKTTVTIGGVSSVFKVTTEKLAPALQEKCGTITSNEKWIAATVYLVTCNIVVPEGVTLTIDAGTVVKFRRPVKIFDDPLLLKAEGTLNINGTADNKVYLTSSYDDTIGGDTNNDGGATSPRAGDWLRISFEGGNGNIKFAEFRYGNSAISVRDSSPNLQDIQIKDSRGAAITANVDDSPQIKDITFKNVDIAGLQIRPSTITGDVTWNQTSITYYLSEDFTIAEGATLTIDAGAVIKFRRPVKIFDDPLLLRVEGTLNVNGTVNNKVYFTSSYDDTIGGDTNDDGGTTSPQTGNWKEIFFDGGTGNIKHAEIRYANVGIWTRDSAPTITNSKLTKNNYGVYSDKATGKPTVSQSCFTKNIRFGAFAKDGGTINAKNNYWDSPDGPSDKGPGLGNAVSEGVDFQPFLTTCP